MFNKLIIAPRLRNKKNYEAWSKSEKLWRWSVYILMPNLKPFLLTHWGRVTHICVSKQTIIGSDNGLSPGRRQAITVVETKFGMHSSFGRVVGHLHLSEPEFYSSEKKYKYLFTTPQQGLKRYWEKRRDDSLMLATIHEDTWKVLNMQHITPNSKSWNYSDMLGGGVWKIKGPTYLVDGSHQDPNPHPHLLRKKDLLHQEITMLWLPYLLRNNPHIKEFIDYMYLVNNFVIWGLNFQIYLTIPGISSLLVIMICFWPGQFELLPTWYLEKLSTFHILDSSVLVINE